jgi:tetratricopeptide (TPR) repeat protein
VGANPQTAEDYYWRTRAYNELARQAFSYLADLPASAEVHELLAKIHFSQKSYDAAAKDWEEALKFSPDNPYYEQGRAISLSAAGNFETARPLLEKATKQSPDSAELNYWTGFTLLGLEKPEEAIPYLEKAVKGDPTVLQPQRDLARAYLRVGQVEKAIPHLKAALPLDNDGTLYYQLAQAYRKSGQKELEKEMLAKFRKIQSSSNIEKKNFEKSLEITPP